LKEQYKSLNGLVYSRTSHWSTTIQKEDIFSFSCWHISLKRFFNHGCSHCIIKSQFTKFRNETEHCCRTYISSSKNVIWKMEVLNCKKKKQIVIWFFLFGKTENSFSFWTVLIKKCQIMRRRNVINKFPCCQKSNFESPCILTFDRWHIFCK